VHFQADQAEDIKFVTKVLNSYVESSYASGENIVEVGAIRKTAA